MSVDIRTKSLRQVRDLVLQEKLKSNTHAPCGFEAWVGTSENLYNAIKDDLERNKSWCFLVREELDGIGAVRFHVIINKEALVFKMYGIVI